MIASLPPPHASYTLVEELRELTAPLAVRRQAVNDSEWEELALSKLGARGWGRLIHFRQFYQQGWGNQQGQSLSPRAFEAFVRFLAEANFPVDGKKPSVFLTDRGGLEVCWESVTGKAVQVEFTRHGVEFFNEDTGAEGEAPLSALPNLKQILAL
jgi:hypothetical protein